jgi:hypothetical protein
MGDTGFEPAEKSPRETQAPDPDGSNSGNNAAAVVAPERPADPDLAALVAAWPALPSALRAGIVAMVRAAGPASRPDAPTGAAVALG